MSDDPKHKTLQSRTLALDRTEEVHHLLVRRDIGRALARGAARGNLECMIGSMEIPIDDEESESLDRFAFDGFRDGVFEMDLGAVR